MRKRYENARLMNLAVLCIIVCLAVLATKAQTSKRPQTGEQSHFELEQDFSAPVTVPDNVLELLRHDPVVLASRCIEPGKPSGQISASSFEASSLHLHDLRETDLIVKAKNPCLFGANIGPFWIFRNTPKGYTLVLSVSALGIEVLGSKSHGYRDIRAGAVAAGKVVNVTYRFDGHRYRESGTVVEK